DVRAWLQVPNWDSHRVAVRPYLLNGRRVRFRAFEHDDTTIRTDGCVDVNRMGRSTGVVVHLGEYGELVALRERTHSIRRRRKHAPDLFVDSRAQHRRARL